MGKGSECVIELGAFRAELYTSVFGGPTWEVMARQGGGYRLCLLGHSDLANLKRLLDRIEEREEFQPVLALEEGEQHEPSP